MSEEAHAVIIVHSTSHALRGEKALLQAGISCKLIPVPRHISSDCGVCIRIDAADQDTARQIVDDAQLQYAVIQAIRPV